MKKMILFVMLILALPIMLIAQAVEPPTGWGDVIVNYKVWFASMGAVVVLTNFVTSFLTAIFKISREAAAKVISKKQLVSWAVAIALLVGADLLNIGYVAEFPILMAVAHGLAVGLASNGVRNIEFWKSILNAIEEKLWKSKPIKPI